MLSAASINAHAEQITSLSNFNYDAMEVHVGLSDKQIGLTLTKSIHPNAHVSADVSTDTDDDYAINAGINFHAPITDWSDAHGAVLIIYEDIDNRDDTTGWAFEIGYKQWISPQIEANTSFQWNYLEDSSVGGKLGTLFHATSEFSIGASFGINEVGGDVLSLTTRYEF
ncbi:hypothetical protein [Vibrio sp. PNB22_3_1]